MKKITFLERGFVSDFKRIGDYTRTVILDRCFISGGLLYGYLDRFNVVSIPLEDIREEVEL